MTIQKCYNTGNFEVLSLNAVKKELNALSKADNAYVKLNAGQDYDADHYADFLANSYFLEINQTLYYIHDTGLAIGEEVTKVVCHHTNGRTGTILDINWDAARVQVRWTKDERGMPMVATTWVKYQDLKAAAHAQASY